MIVQIIFRELNLEDIPRIYEISSKIWDGDDYVPNIIEEWLEDKKCYNYAVINKDGIKNQLIAFGRIKILSSDLFWFEGGRVDPEYQKQGIGKKMMDFSLNYAKEH
ncbi:MAG: GNAT family N-acetyltransferase [Candidatus Lokiarchaeota archaeon]|nr:GNAT family N-acetyltransferase [Candidatus Lokiarchaeota archaeon]